MQTIRIGHSPDPDDAFMFYALTSGKVRIQGVGIEHVLEDIESLNRRARTAELEVTAVSFATYLLVADRYRMMDSGASMGKGYGPILVAREPLDPRAIAEKVVANPGSHTTAALAGAARLDRVGADERGRGARVRDALRARDRQGDVPPVRPDVRQRPDAHARQRGARRRRAALRGGAAEGVDL